MFIPPSKLQAVPECFNVPSRNTSTNVSKDVPRKNHFDFNGNTASKLKYETF